MNHIKLEIRVEAPIEHVWAYMCDTSRWADWQPGWEYADFSGPYPQVGTTYTSKGRMLGFEMKQATTVVEVEPQKLIHEHTDEGPMDSYIRFEPEGGATRLTVESIYEMPGHIPGFVKDIVSKAWIERHMRHMLEDFKVLAEAKVPVPA